MRSAFKKRKLLLRLLVNRFYNRYRAPEARATILCIRRNKVVMLVTGSFCKTCGVVDWIEDIAFSLKPHGIKLKLTNVRELGRDAMLAVFRW